MKRPAEQAGARLTVKVIPKASRNAVRVEPDGHLRVSLTAPPVDGKANAALIALLADRLDLPKRAISIVKGDASRDKTILVTGMSAEAIVAALDARASS